MNSKESSVAKVLTRDTMFDFTAQDEFGPSTSDYTILKKCLPTVQTRDLIPQRREGIGRT